MRQPRGELQSEGARFSASAPRSVGHRFFSAYPISDLLNAPVLAERHKVSGVPIQVIDPTTLIRATWDTNEILHVLSCVTWLHATYIFFQKSTRVKKPLLQILKAPRNP